MKTLKRSLSLVLVLALAFSLCSSAFAVKNFEKFKDGDKVTYIEAVDVLIGIDIVDGIDVTTLSPQGTYTRAQGAALITRLLLGRTGTEKLSDKVSPFSDVPDGYWASGEINHCVNEGIIIGNGDGTFNPEGPLTGYAVMKMVLSALGYGAQGEFKGEQWMINTAKFAFSTDINLVRGIKAENKDYSLTATREEAMLYVFNSFNIPMVHWSTLINEYVKSTSTHPDYAPYQFLNAPHGLYVKLGVWSGFGLGATFVSDRDAYGYRVRTWFANEYKISEAYRVDNILDGQLPDRVKGNITYGDLYAKSYGFDNALEVFVNGDNISSATINAMVGNVTKGNLSQPFTYNGAPMTGAHITLVDNVFDPFMNVDQVIIVVEYLARVTAVNEAHSTRDRSINIEMVSKTTNTPPTQDFIETEEFSVGDYILIVPNYAGCRINGTFTLGNAFKNPISMKLAKSETSKVSAYTDATPGTSSVTIASGKYLYNFTEATRRTGFDYSADYKFYFDTEGNVIGYSKVAVKHPYLYVTQSQSQAEGTFLFLDSGKAAVQVNVTYFDGTSEVLYLEVKTSTRNVGGLQIGDKYYTIDGTDYRVRNRIAPIPTGVYTYTTNSNGTTLVKAENYEATVLNTVRNGAIVTGTSTPNDLPLNASSNTSLVITKNNVISKHLGFQNFDTVSHVTGITGNCDHIGFLTDGNGVITDILVIGSIARGQKEYVYGVYTGEYENKTADSDWFYTFQVGPGDISIPSERGPASSYRTVGSWTDIHTAGLVKGTLYRLELDANGVIIDWTAAPVAAVSDLNGFDVDNKITSVGPDHFTDDLGSQTYFAANTVVYDLRDYDNNKVYNFRLSSIADLKKDMIISYVYSDRVSADPNDYETALIFITGPALPNP